jgi:hypothetical protein
LRLQKLESSITSTQTTLTKLVKDFEEHKTLQGKVVEAQVKSLELLFETVKQIEKKKKDKNPWF